MPYRVTPAGVQMLVDGEWIAVPDHVIQYRALPGDTGETAGGHWCGAIRYREGEEWNIQPTAQSYRLTERPSLDHPFLREGRIQPVP